MTTIIGVDFSGAKEDRNTWITQARLKPDGVLLFDSAQPARRSDLFDLLATVPTPGVAALDFPFGVPVEFARHLNPNNPPADMPDLWRSVAAINPDDFTAARNNFVERHGEPKRAGDAARFPESYSPLHRVNPNMVPMTCHGINLLHRLHQTYPNRWHVPPLKPTAAPDDTVTLLELMPGAFLKAVGLPYKGYKKSGRALERRDRIIDGLTEKSGVLLPNLADVSMGCRANDDCLDSVVAAVAASAWALDATRFRHPEPQELPNAKLEGWIYVPKSPD